MTPRITSRRLALTAAGVFVAFVVMCLVYPGGKPLARSASITATRTDGGAVVTALVPQPYWFEFVSLVPKGGQPVPWYMTDYHVVGRKAVTDGEEITCHISFEPEGPYCVFMLLNTYAEGPEDLRNRIRHVVRTRDYRHLFRRSWAGCKDAIDTVVFSHAEPEGFTNRLINVIETTNRYFPKLRKVFL